MVPYRTDISGIRPKDLENAQNFKTVKNEVAKLIRDKIVLGHSIENDISTLFLQLQTPYKMRRDTSELFLIDGKTPSLKSLAKEYLGKENFQVKNTISNNLKMKGNSFFILLFHIIEGRTRFYRGCKSNNGIV